MKKGWEIKKLGEVCEFQNGQAHEKYIEKIGKYIVINSKFISSDGKIHKKTNKALSPLFKGDIVFVMSDVPNGKTLAKCYLVEKDEKYTLNQRICVIRSNYYDKKFLYYHLNRHEYLLSFDNGENQTNLRKNDILNCPLVCPTLHEQKQIAAILDKVFETIEKVKANAERNLENAKELFESYLQNIFNDIYNKWEKKTLGEIAKIIGGYSFKSTDFKKQGKYQVIRIGNVRPGIIRGNENPVFIHNLDESKLKRALLFNNDVIITQTGTKKKRDYGYTAIINKDNYLLNQRISAIRFSNNYSHKFFLYFSWTKNFKDQYFANETGTVGQGNVGIDAIKNAIIPYSTLNDQQSIVQKLDTISNESYKLKIICQKKIKDLEELKKSILQKAFNGELETSKIEVT